MTVYDFLYYAIEDMATIKVYNFTTKTEELMSVDEAKEKYGDCELCSFDSYIYKNTLCINIDEEM